MLAPWSNVEESAVTQMDEVDQFYFRLCFVIVAFFAVAGAFFAWHQYAYATPAIPQAISTVIVGDETGHGSGVYIGRGIVLSAAHVVGDKPKMIVIDSLGDTRVATVLRSDKAADIAILHIDNAPMATSPVNCSLQPTTGDEVVAIGSPLDLHFIHLCGRVAADTSMHNRWKDKDSIIVDMALAPGMSGGGVFNKSGNLIGIAVGIAAFKQVPFAIGYVVPIQAACELLGQV